MIAQELMTENPMTITETASVADAMKTMADEGIRHLPVVRGSRSETVVGILSDRDLASLGVARVASAESFDELRARMSQPVSTLMTGGVITVDADTEVAEVIDLMLDEKLSAVPVVESGTARLVGIVSYVDVLKAARDLFD